MVWHGGSAGGLDSAGSLGRSVAACCWARWDRGWAGTGNLALRKKVNTLQDKDGEGNVVSEFEKLLIEATDSLNSLNTERQGGVCL